MKKFSSTLIAFVLVFATALTLAQNSALAVEHARSTETTKNNLSSIIGVHGLSTVLHSDGRDMPPSEKEPIHMNSVTARTAMNTPADAKRLLDATTITNQPEEANAVENFCLDAPELTTSLASGNAMDVQSLCLSQDFESMTDVEKVVTSVSFSKPDKEWFFRVHPEFKRYMAVISEKKENYVVVPKLLPQMGRDAVKKLIVLCVTKQGVPFFWPLKIEAQRGLDEWSKSALVAMETAKTKWTKMKSNLDTQCYEAFTAKGELGEPAWPETDINELLSIAIRDRVISTMDHPVIKRLNGEL